MAKDKLKSLNNSEADLEKDIYLENSPQTIFEKVPDEIYERVLKNDNFSPSAYSVEEWENIFEQEFKEQMEE